MTGPDEDRALEAATDRLLSDQRGQPAPPGAAGDPRPHQLAAALAGQRPGATTPRPAFTRRLHRLIDRELGGGRGEDPAVGHPGRGQTWSRRQWLAGTGVAVAAGVSGALLGELLPGHPAAPTPIDQGPLVPDQGRWQGIAHVEAITADHPVPFVAGAIAGVLVRERGGGIAALSAICTHLGCRVGWAATERVFVCPCHGARFARSGAYAGTAWPGAYPSGLPPLPRLRSRVMPDGEVQVFVV